VGVVGPYLFGQPAHLAERGEVGLVRTELIVVRFLADLAQRGLHALLVSFVQQHRGPGSDQVVGDSPPKPVVAPVIRTVASSVSVTDLSFRLSNVRFFLDAGRFVLPAVRWSAELRDQRQRSDFTK
jgi:hypothetical protein